MPTPSTSWLQQAFHARLLLKTPLFALPLATCKFKHTPILHTSHTSFLLLCIIHMPNNHDGMMLCYSNFSGFFSSFPVLSILPQGWRCHSADCLLDPLKWILVKPFGLQDLFTNLCGVQGVPEAIRAVESWVATGTSCTWNSSPITAWGSQVTEHPPKHGSIVCSQCYCTEEISITGILGVTRKFIHLGL